VTQDQQPARTVLPIPEPGHVGLTTYDAKDPDRGWLVRLGRSLVHHPGRSRLLEEQQPAVPFPVSHAGRPIFSLFVCAAAVRVGYLVHDRRAIAFVYSQ
jgi:hypothetical protein